GGEGGSVDVWGGEAEGFARGIVLVADVALPPPDAGQLEGVENVGGDLPAGTGKVGAIRRMALDGALDQYLRQDCQGENQREHNQHCSHGGVPLAHCEARASRQVQTSPAMSTIILSFAHCCSSERMLPSSVLANPHWGERQSCSSGAERAACSQRRLMSSWRSSAPLLEVTRPTTTRFFPRGRKRSGANPPARSVSYSRK